MKEALFWSREGDHVRCQLCPQACLIGEGERGLCGPRQVINGRLMSLNYGRIAALALDPFEKKPLYHFYPGGDVLSVGTVGCNLHCPFCQNANLSRFFDDDLGEVEDLKQFDVDELCAIIEEYNTTLGVAFTYSEPVVWYEYVLDVMQVCHEKGISNVIVTNGYINPEPLEKWLPFLSAANVDLKTFREEGYQRLGGHVEPVKRTIERLFRAGVHVEVTTLVVPGFNDSLEEIGDLAAWLASLSPEIPFHLSRYFPHYLHRKPATSLEFLFKARTLAKTHLHHVYVGNVEDKNITFCHHCGKMLIERGSELIVVYGLTENRCDECGGVLCGMYAIDDEYMEDIEDDEDMENDGDNGDD